jgi:hypothetical protein
MFQDFNELLSLFNAHSVKYLIVGGYAVSFHAQPRATKDIDILIQPDATNAKAVYEALAKFGERPQGVLYFRRRPYGGEDRSRQAAGYCGRCGTS